MEGNWRFFLKYMQFPPKIGKAIKLGSIFTFLHKNYVFCPIFMSKEVYLSPQSNPHPPFERMKFVNDNIKMQVLWL